MKTNFKTLALQAGVGAALAAGSLSASAAITAVPAPAQLVPLFYYTGNGIIADGDINTGVRVVVPKSVGADTVVDILRGDSGLTAQTTWNSSTQGFVSATNYIHYWVMDQHSAEIHNARLPVTPDDECYFYASELLAAGTRVLPGCNATVTGAAVGAGAPTYLILTNESAINGGNPTFLFSAQAWLENGGDDSSMASAVSLPVLGLADAADNTAYPTPGNNVIELYSGAGPIASPIHTGIRTSGTGDVADLRVIDIPVHRAAGSENTVVVWTDVDANGGGAYINIRQYNVNADESQVSRGTISFPNQLNFLTVGLQGAGNGIGLSDAYTTSVLSDTNLVGGGFVKLVIPAVALPSDWSEAGAYNSIVVFNIPSHVDNTYDTDASELAVDTGWFTGQ